MAEQNPPIVVVLGGPNGAGKSTIVPHVLQRCYKIDDYVNADEIARGLSPFRPEKVALQAGKIMLTRVRQLAAGHKCFAFESNLSSRTFAPFLRKLKSEGNLCRVYFCWVSSPELSIARVARRVSAGGHHIPEQDIRRRYYRAIRNFFELYQPLADEWRLYDNTEPNSSHLVASGVTDRLLMIEEHATWKRIKAQRHEQHET